jgi:hypothetical protein
VRQDILIALSLANLWFLRIWSETLTYNSEDTFWMKLPFGPSEYAATILGVLLVGAFYFAGFRIARRFPNLWFRRTAALVFVATLLVPVNGLRAVLSTRQDWVKPMISSAPLAFKLGGVLAAAAIAAAILMWPARSVKAVRTLGLVLWPLLAVTFLQAGWKAFTFDPAPFQNRPYAAMLARDPGSPRVVWIIFDEWDYRMSFDHRPRDLHLPAVDAFRSESLFATAADPPAGDTVRSIPSLLTGKRVQDEKHPVKDELYLKYRGTSEFVPWSRQHSIFRRARSAGFNSALTAFHLPACRTINQQVNSCEWWPMPTQSNSTGDSIPEKTARQIQSLFETRGRSIFGRPVFARQHRRNYGEMLASAEKHITDPAFGLVLAHLPVPHFPHIYNRVTRTLTDRHKLGIGYYDNLALMDLTFARLRTTMEESGVWNNSVIIVSSDHPNRQSMEIDGREDQRVPFLVHFPGQTKAITVNRPFNTVVTGDLIHGILTRSIQTPEQTAAWLELQ